ncbi:MAG TPA: hypothetical protein VN909_05400 [Candidatus Dormibacteraeota bacterium]|nr:hypothetical protein [Candidatus Dormibacteraeota bacterium]
MEYRLLNGEDLSNQKLVNNSTAVRTAGKRGKSRSAIEYALLLCLLATVALIAAQGVGHGLNLLFASVSSSL